MIGNPSLNDSKKEVVDGSSFIDKDVHKILERKGFSNPKGEWFRCTVEDVKTAVNNLVNGDSEISERIKSFPLRPEQKEAIKKTKSYIASSIGRSGIIYKRKGFDSFSKN